MLLITLYSYFPDNMHHVTCTNNNNNNNCCTQILYNLTTHLLNCYPKWFSYHHIQLKIAPSVHSKQTHILGNMSIQNTHIAFMGYIYIYIIAVTKFTCINVFLYVQMCFTLIWYMLCMYIYILVLDGFAMQCFVYGIRHTSLYSVYIFNN